MKTLLCAPAPRAADFCRIISKIKLNSERYVRQLVLLNQHLDTVVMSVISALLSDRVTSTNSNEMDEILMRPVVTCLPLACLFGVVALDVSVSLAQSDVPSLSTPSFSPSSSVPAPPLPSSGVLNNDQPSSMKPQKAASLVAMTGTETVDSQLKKTANEINQLLLRSGYLQADSAQVNSALSKGSDAANTLRTALGLGCVIRVDVSAYDAFGVALRVIVDAQNQVQSVDVQAPLSDIPNRVLLALRPLVPPAQVQQSAAAQSVHVSPMIPEPLLTQPPELSDPNNEPRLDRIVLVDGRVTRGFITQVAAGQYVIIRMETGAFQTFRWGDIQRIDLHGSDRQDRGGLSDAVHTRGALQRKDGSSRGGFKLLLDVRGQLMGLYSKVKHTFRVLHSDGQKIEFSGYSPAGGGGLGVGFQIGATYLGLPKREQRFVWAVRAGTGVDLGYGAFAYQEDNFTELAHIQNGSVVKPGVQRGGDVTVSGAWMVGVPVFLGFQLGVAKYDDFAKLRGWTVGVDWRPTYTYTKPSDLDGLSKYNLGGVQANLDLVSLDADSSGVEPQFRLSFTYLPRIGNNATYAMIGFGAAWY